MLAWFGSVLAILALAVVTTVSSAHAARMDVGHDHAMHVAETMHAPAGGGLACDGDQPCGAADAEMCEYVCAGLSSFLPAWGADTGRGHAPARHDMAVEALPASRAPGLDERPPKLRLP